MEVLNVMIVSNIKVEFAENPLGIDVQKPRLSWELASEALNVKQSAYRILVASDRDQLLASEGDLWDSGKVQSDQSIHVEYAGQQLISGQKVFWKVQVWDQDGKASDWSRIGYWSMGILEQSEWTGRFIGRKKPEGVDLLPSPYFRKEIDLNSTVKRAVVYATSLGVYELYVNGQRVSGDYFAPGWTDYDKRLQVQTHDVTDLLQTNKAALGAVVGTGWYAGYIGMFGKELYGDNPHLLLELHVEYEDGSSEKWVTDDTWKTTVGPIEYSDMLMGETYDARKVMDGWNEPGFDDVSWDKPVVMESYDGLLVAQVDPPVRAVEEVLPVSSWKTEWGTTIFDLGQNMVGWVRLRLEQPSAGQKIKITSAEMLNEDGTLHLANVRRAVPVEHYIAAGSDEAEVYEPSFTFHGFRYVEVEGLQEIPTLQTVIGRMIMSDTPQKGQIETSSVMLNKLYSNINWGQRGNFLSIPTDCPQRDERLGWTGDAQVFCRTATYNMDVASFFDKYMIDVVDAQFPSGAFPDVAPDGGWDEWKRKQKRLNWHADDNNAWGDAGVIIPWTMYQVYADVRILERTYPAMVKWIAYLQEHTDGLIRPGYTNYGDWLSMHSETPRDVTDTAYFAYSTSLLAKIAEVLGKAEDVKKYTQLFAEIKTAFEKTFVDEEGRIKGDTQTCYVVALQFDLLSEVNRKKAIDHLLSDIRANDDHLTTGFIGVGRLLHALSDEGHFDVAYTLLNQHTFPSWLYSVKHGATTMWERWDAWTEERGFHEDGMNSFNHYAFGAVGEWMYKNMLGIDTDPNRPGYEHAVIAPVPGGELSFVKGRYETIRGAIQVEWTHERSHFELVVNVPANMTATLTVPGATVQAEDSGALQAKVVSTEAERTVYEIGSGTYTFTSVVKA